MSDLSIILADCLDSLHDGSTTPEECLTRYPEYKDELESLLQSVQLVQHADLGDLDAAEARVQERLMSRLFGEVAVTALPEVAGGHGTAVQPDQTTERKVIPFRSRYLPSPYTRKILLRTAAVFIAAFALGTGVLKASADSLPDSPLYPLKLNIENVQMQLTSGNENKALLALQFAQERIQEAQQLASQGKQPLSDQGLQHAQNDIQQASVFISHGSHIKASTEQRLDAVQQELDDSRDQIDHKNGGHDSNGDQQPNGNGTPSNGPGSDNTGGSGSSSSGSSSGSSGSEKSGSGTNGSSGGSGSSGDSGSSGGSGSSGSSGGSGDQSKTPVPTPEHSGDSGSGDRSGSGDTSISPNYSHSDRGSGK